MRRLIILLHQHLLLGLCALGIMAAAADARSILRDPGIEYSLNRLARPIYEAAGLSASRMKIVIINDRSPNAFVMDNQHIFIHSGLIFELESAEELQAVIAHEVAHITSGHITRRHAHHQAAERAAAIGMILSGVALIGGVDHDVATGVGLGVVGAAQRNVLAHSRADEAAADHAAVRFLAQAGIAPSAMVTVLERFEGQELLSVQRRDPYTRSHPLSRERMRALEGYVAATTVRGAEDKESAYWYARARGKLEAFLLPSSRTLRALPKGDTSDVTLMRRAAALHRIPKPQEAIDTISQLVAARPKDPYYAELQGQILLENRQFAAAVTAYTRAADLAPNNGLIQASLGRALLAEGRPDRLKRAINALEYARQRDGYNSFLLRQLASAYAKNNQPGLAMLNASEAHLLTGAFSSALAQATRAQSQLSHGSPGWNRALDVIKSAEDALNRS